MLAVEYRRYIQDGRCPFCQSLRRYRSLASHTVVRHGVTAYELRELAGVGYSASICSEEYSRERSVHQSCLVGLLPHIAKALEDGRHIKKGKRNLKLTIEERRPLVTEHIKSDRNRPERKAAFRNLIGSSVVQAKIKKAAQSRSPSIQAAQTHRIIKAHADWMKRVGKEIVSSTVRSGFTKYVARVGINEATRQRKLASLMSVPALRNFHADKVEHEIWLTHVRQSAARRAKIPKELYPVIASRKLSGEKSEDLTLEFNVDRSFLDRIVRVQS